MASNQAFTNVGSITPSINNLDISNNLTVGNNISMGTLNSAIKRVQSYTALAASANRVINLTAADSGTTILVNLDAGAAGNINFVLPALNAYVGPGMTFKFVLRGAVADSSGDIRIYPAGYTQAAGISATQSVADTMVCRAIDVATNNFTAIRSAVGNSTANDQGGINFQGGQALGGDELLLWSVSNAAPTNQQTMKWCGTAYTSSATSLVAS